jgi:hypothetical protein
MRFKNDSPWPSLIGLTLCLAIILVFSVYYGLDRRTPDSSSRSSISESITPEPTATPTAEPTLTPVITPTAVTVDLNRNLMALPTGSDGSFKAWESIDSINDDTSLQYAMKPFYRTDSLGFVRFNNYYVVAVGQFYSNRIGECFRVVFEERTICVMVGDVKEWKDTMDGMYCLDNGSIIEFIINPEVMSENVQLQGDLSCLGMGGKVISIEREEMEP